MYKSCLKRCLDIVLSLCGIIVLSPIMFIVMILIKVETPGDAIFKQERLGVNGKVFKMYKFRSMCVGAEFTGSGQYSFKDDPRVTKVGRIIRKTSIDELPQLFNILKGEMSFIGPRPALTYHPWSFSEYTDEQKKMFSVRPGITGWAQVHGRKDVEWHKRIELNVWYTEHVSFLLDLKILFLTFYKVIMMKDNDNVTVTVKTAENEE
ncbi:MAG: sugar transferase [Faecalibacillus sp.]